MPGVRSQKRRIGSVRPSRGIVLGLLLLVAITTALRFANGPIYDDVAVIEHGTVIHQHGRALEVFGKNTMFISAKPVEIVSSVDTYRPIPALSFFVNSMLSGKKLWSYHLTNLVLHGACVVLVFAVLRRWLGGGKLKAAGIGAAFFAVQPWLAEAHVWINGRSDPFALAFGLGAALVLLRRSLSPAKLSLAGVLFFGGLLSKETLLSTLPAFLFLDPKGTLPLTERLKRVAPLALAAIAYLALRLRVLGGMKTHNDPESLKTAIFRGPALVFDGLYHLIVPSFPFVRSLRDDYKHVPNAVFIGAFAALLLLTVFVFRQRKRFTSGPFALFFFVGALAPVSGITVLPWVGFGRYLYLPAAALALVVAQAIARAKLTPRMRKLAGALVALVLLVDGVLLVWFTTDMAHDETLYIAATARRPEQGWAWASLGTAYMETQQWDKSIGALERSVELDPKNPNVRAQLVAILAQQQRCEEANAGALLALDEFRGPEAGQFELTLAVCAASPETAAFRLRRCLLRAPKLAQCRTLLTELLTTDANARAAIRKMAEIMPSPQFDAEWAELAREPEPIDH